MSVANTRTSTTYQEALSATKTLWEDTSAGLLEKSEGGSLANTTKQLNTVIFLLIKIDSKLAELTEKVSQIDTRIKNLEKAKLPQAQDWKGDLEDITRKIAAIKISEKPKELGGNLKVIKNPYDILGSIKK
ncbi:ORF2 protein [Enset leaf streak virus]|nr:ORF2 protein [Enset leaf streak virus]